MACAAAKKTLLSIDWDYFIYSRNNINFSYAENYRNLMDGWYKKWIECKLKGIDIQKNFKLSPKVEWFCDKLKEHFNFAKNTKVYVSDSHALSYYVTINEKCKSIYLFDAHADLGYGGLFSLKFEVNCANWLGKLFENKCIEEAFIIYSPNTKEKPEYFNEINKNFNIRYLDFSGLDKDIKISAIHICRSGAWTPPWLDKEFFRFLHTMGLPYQIIDCPMRKWDVDNISFSDKINYLMF